MGSKSIEEQLPPYTVHSMPLPRFSLLICQCIVTFLTIAYQIAISLLYVFHFDPEIPNDQLHGIIQQCPYFMTGNILTILGAFYAVSVGLLKEPVGHEVRASKRAGYLILHTVVFAVVVGSHIGMGLKIEYKKQRHISQSSHITKS